MGMRGREREGCVRLQRPGEAPYRNGGDAGGHIALLPSYKLVPNLRTRQPASEDPPAARVPSGCPANLHHVAGASFIVVKVDESVGCVCANVFRGTVHLWDHPEWVRAAAATEPCFSTAARP
jgi:hypothetical protein